MDSVDQTHSPAHLCVATRRVVEAELGHHVVVLLLHGRHVEHERLAVAVASRQLELGADPLAADQLRAALHRALDLWGVCEEV